MLPPGVVVKMDVQDSGEEVLGIAPKLKASLGDFLRCCKSFGREKDMSCFKENALKSLVDKLNQLMATLDVRELNHLASVVVCMLALFRQDAAAIKNLQAKQSKGKKKATLAQAWCPYGPPGYTERSTHTCARVPATNGRFTGALPQTIDTAMSRTYNISVSPFGPRK